MNELEIILMDIRPENCKHDLGEIPVMIKVWREHQGKINYWLIRENGDVYGGGTTTTKEMLHSLELAILKSTRSIKELEFNFDNEESDYKKDLCRRQLNNEVKKREKLKGYLEVLK